MLNLLELMNTANLNLVDVDKADESNPEAAEAFGLFLAQLINQIGPGNDNEKQAYPELEQSVAMNEIGEEPQDVNFQAGEMKSSPSSTPEFANSELPLEETALNQEGISEAIIAESLPETPKIQTTNSGAQSLDQLSFPAQSMNATPLQERKNPADEMLREIQYSEQNLKTLPAHQPQQNPVPSVGEQTTLQETNQKAQSESIMLAQDNESTFKQLDTEAVTQIKSQTKSMDTVQLMETSGNANPNQMISQPLNQPRDVPLEQSLAIDTPVANPDWSDNFKQQIVWMGQQKINEAKISLQPDTLGPVQVQLKMEQDHATLLIHAHSAQVRDLIEQSIPQLRDGLQQQGIDLAQVNIESNNQQHQQRQQMEEQQQGSSIKKEFGEAETHASKEPGFIRQTQGMIDYFA